MWPFKKRYQLKTQIDPEGRWSVSQGTYEGKPLFARINMSLKSLVGHPEYSSQVGVAVPLHTPNEHGFPTQKESEELNSIEDSLCSELLVDNESLFAVVITTNGMREFVFYTSDPTSAQAKVAKVSQLVTGHEVQLMVQPDPEWNVYKRFA